MKLKWNLLGKPHIEYNGEIVNGRLPAKARLLLYYLVNNPQSHNRIQLAEWIWEGMPDPSNNMRGAVRKLRRVLGDDMVIGGRFDIAINPDYEYVLDVEEFDNLIQLAANVGGATERAHLRDAVELYKGDFLEDILIDSKFLYDEWLLPEQERLKQQALAAYQRLLDICREQGDYEAGIRYAQAMLLIEPGLESGHRQLIWFYDRTGRRAQALNQFDVLEDILAEKFNVSPSDETFDLYRQIVDGERADESAGEQESEETAVPFLAPKLLPYFSGRDEELADLLERLQPGEARQLIGLVGPPGVGKTALAIELAHRLRAVFPDGVLWMNATLDDSMSVAERWATAYGHDYSRVSDVEERTAVLRDLLAEKQALIICDDVTNAAKTRPFLPEKGRSTILLTSRSENLIRRLGAELLDVKVLSEENGRALLASIITEERIAEEEEAAAEILTLLEGLPLAIAIAGQRLAQVSRRRLDSFAAQLRDASARIDLADKDRAVRTSFAVSWNGLDQIQQHVFSRLAVFEGRSFAVDAVTAIAEMDYFQALDRLDDQAALSLLNDVGDGRYRQHTLLADFAREKLGGDDAPYRQMIAYYQAFAAGHIENYAELELEWENLSASIDKAHEMILCPAVLGLTKTLQPAWFRRGRYYEARRAFPLAVAAAEALDDQATRARFMCQWGYVCTEQNDWDEAQTILLQSLRTYENLEDLAGIAAAQSKLAWVFKYKSEFDEAERMLVASRKLWYQLGDEAGVAKTISDEAHFRNSRGEYDEARKLFEQALRLQDGLDDKVAFLRTLRSLAHTINITGADLVLAKQYAVQANQLADDIKDKVEKPAILMLLSSICLKGGDFDESKEYALDSIEHYKDIGDLQGQAMVYYVLCGLDLVQGIYDVALQHGEKSLKICQALGDKAGIAFSLQRLGDVWEHLNQFQKACERWREALEIARQIQHRALVIDLEERIEKYAE